MAIRVLLSWLYWSLQWPAAAAVNQLFRVDSKDFEKPRHGATSVGAGLGTGRTGSQRLTIAFGPRRQHVGDDYVINDVKQNSCRRPAARKDARTDPGRTGCRPN